MSEREQAVEAAAIALQSFEGTVAIFGAFEPATAHLMATASPGARCEFFPDDVITAEQLKAAGHVVRPTIWPDATRSFDAAVVIHDRGKDVLEFDLGRAARVVRPDGDVYASGSNRSGIRSAEPIFARWLDGAQSVLSARHSRVFCGKAARFADSLDAFELRFHVALGDEMLEVVSFPGVFSHGRLDDGTEMLLDTLPARIGGRVLDVGTGAGIIAVVAARRGAHVVAVDSDMLAVEAARRTAAANGVVVEVVAADTFPHAGTFDLILSNPPFHEGAKTSLGCAFKLMDNASARLAPGGRLRIVANRFLPYAERLAEKFGVSPQVLAESGRYRVYEATRSESTREKRMPAR